MTLRERLERGLFLTSLWALFGLAIVLEFVTLNLASYWDVPGVSQVQLGSAITLTTLICIGLFPPIADRINLRFGSRPISLLLLGLVASLVLSTWSFSAADRAWASTPEGARIKAERDREAALTAARERQQAAADAQELAEINRSTEKARALNAKLEEQIRRRDEIEHCVSSFRDVVKESLHNPRSFEYVGTAVEDSGRYNVVMRFRAENGFGAIRTADIRAKIDSSSCEIQDIGDIEEL